MSEFNTKPLNEIINLIIDNVYYQTMGIDVAIPYIIGAPGAGKTATVNSMTNELGWGLVSTHFALKPLEETGGIPQFERVEINGKDELATIWSFPDIMKNIYKMSEKHEVVIWLLDDMHLCGAVHAALLYELLTERKLREFKLPKNVGIVMAGNHGSSKAGAKTQFSAIINRCCLYPIHTEYSSWRKNFAIGNNIHPSILSFLGNDMHQQFFHEEEQVETPWGSPRSWTRFSNTLRCMEQRNNNSQIQTDWLIYVTSGHVSKEAASSFANYYQIFMKFDIDKILANIDGYKLPESNIDKYALVFASIEFYCSNEHYKTHSSNFGKLLIKIGEQNPDLVLVSLTTILDYERILGKKSVVIELLDHLRKIDPTFTQSLIKELKDVM